ncbi:lytic transglycosylase domain-containing protein [Nocardioides sp. JQ2195]|uniref:lytic transglycosylase domain-containing protein n=1 Tax=Nocardioides sp. JQ2195 TaxID=2592334 RepID=UPI00143E799B|nr:lytic transglycosylase domain-containing protein [Nocardioides sp. JQ2195]QIX26739.1 lytic transglycosylase domain-containing protein [Nocardioides sp. JQ2195]
MKASESGITRLLPATILAVAAVAGLAGSLHSLDASGPTARTSPEPRVATPAEVTDAAIELPASMTRITSSDPETSARLRVVAASTTRAIPPEALAGYQRAASVINASDPSCHIDWELIAAIGRVESDHGQHGSSSLDDNGVARPAIIGVALNGRRTARIPDTDAGQYDHDTVHDRAVGPMQFIPSTWSIVGVDADADGIRNPQDIDDASLAAAVYLCSGKDDLSTAAGRSSAVYRYNHSKSYVNVVLELMEKYVDGNFAATPTATPISASMTVNSFLVGSFPESAARSAVWVPDRDAPSTAAVHDKVHRASGGLSASSDSTFTEAGPTTEPTTPTQPPTAEQPTEPTPADSTPAEPTAPDEPTGSEQPTEPAPAEPTAPPQAEPPADPAPTEPTAPPAAEPAEESTPPEAPPAPQPAETEEKPKPEPEAPKDQAGSDDPSTGPDGVLVDDPSTPDVDESIPPADAP